MNWLEYESEEASLEVIQQHCDNLFKRYGIRVHSMSTEEMQSL
jgi:hypothetical protein